MPESGPPSNTAVVEAMQGVARHDTPERRAMLFRLLLDATLLAVTPEVPSTAGPRVVEGGQPLRFVTLSDPDGTVLPLFTDVDAIRAWRQVPQGYLGLPAKQLFAMAAAGKINKIVMNPGSPTGGVVTGREIEALAHGRLPLADTEVTAEDTQVWIGRPAVPPPAELLDTLRASLTAEPAAGRGWYFQIAQGSMPPEMVIAIRLRDGLDAGEKDRVMRSFVERAGQVAPGASSVLFQVADDAMEAQLEAGLGHEFFRR